MNRIIHIGLIVFLLILSGCSVTKPSPTNLIDTSLDLKSVVKEIRKVENKFKNLRNRAKVTFDNGKTIQSVILNFRVEENEALWISASMIVPIAKALITKDQLIFYEQFQKTYINTSLKYNNTTSLPSISIELIQNILFGKPIVLLRHTEKILQEILMGNLNHTV